MKEYLLRLKDKLNFLSTANQHYKELRRHLDKQAIGYPATLSGFVSIPPVSAACIAGLMYTS
jgi:hypothetical protein